LNKSPEESYDRGQDKMEELKDKLAEKGVTIVLEPGGWYTGGFAQTYGLDLPYILEFSGYEVYPNVPYGAALFKPEYFLSFPSMYTPIHSPGIQITQYSPFSESFTNLPPHLGGRRIETFTGQSL